MHLGLQSSLAELVVAGGGGAILAIQTLKYVGSRWMENRFSQRLQDLKHENDREIASLKLRIDQQLDRAVKLNQREFDALPEIWAKIADAHAHALDFVHPLKQYPDFARMSEEHRLEALAASKLADWQKKELLAKGLFEQTSYYADAAYWHELHEARDASRAASDAVTKGAMFLSPEAYSLLNEFAVAIFRAIQTREINREMGESDDQDHAAVYRKTGQERFEQLTLQLRERYWPRGH